MHTLWNIVDHVYFGWLLVRVVRICGIPMFDLIVGWIRRIAGNHGILLPKLKVSCSPTQKLKYSSPRNKENVEELLTWNNSRKNLIDSLSYLTCSVRVGILFWGVITTNKSQPIPNHIRNYFTILYHISLRRPHHIPFRDYWNVIGNGPPAHHWHLPWTQKSLGQQVRSTCNKRTTGASTRDTQKPSVLLVVCHVFEVYLFRYTDALIHLQIGRINRQMAWVCS